MPTRNWASFIQGQSLNAPPDSPPKSTQQDNSADIKLYFDRLLQYLNHEIDSGGLTRSQAAGQVDIAMGLLPDTKYSDIASVQTELPFFSEIYGKPDPYNFELPKPILGGEWLQKTNKWANEAAKEAAQKAAKKSSEQERLNAHPQQPYGNLSPDLYSIYGQKAGERQVAMETAFGERQPTEVSPKQNAYDMALAQAQTEQRNRGISFASDQQAAERANRAELFKQFESIRNRKLNSLNTEADWIKRWFTQNEKNPYTPSEPSIDSTMGALSNELSKWTGIAQNYPGTPVNVGDTVTWGDVANQSINTINQHLATLRDLPPEINTPSPAQPTAPTTPDWLANLVPELKTGQPIRSGVGIPTPSGQQWQQLATSTRQRFGGYTDWAGIPINDIVNRMNLMQPNTPYGAGRFGFTPSRQ